MLGDFGVNGVSRKVFILDGDIVRKGLNKDLGFT
jgi:adenylyl-sulfate kinase